MPTPTLNDKFMWLRNSFHPGLSIEFVNYVIQHASETSLLFCIAHYFWCDEMSFHFVMRVQTSQLRLTFHYSLCCDQDFQSIQFVLILIQYYAICQFGTHITSQIFEILNCLQLKYLVSFKHLSNNDKCGSNPTLLFLRCAIWPIFTCKLSVFQY